MHKIDLKNYEIRTDMVIDLTENEKSLKSDSFNSGNLKTSWTELDEKNVIGKKPGTYLTLEFSDITDDDAKKEVANVFTVEFQKMLKKVGYKKCYKTMVIGLGNVKSTPDALGPFVTDKIIVTNHFYEMGVDVDDNLSCVSAFYPGVTGTTGIETLDYIKGVVEKVRPDLVILVDALASSSISRVNKSIQVSNAGITPGSGIGNKRKEISKETLGIPVLAIGVPTVVDAVVIVADTINYMIKNYTYNKNFSKKKVSKFINHPVNYLKEEVKVSNEDKKTLLGLVGTLSEEELKNLTYEVLTPIGYNLMVTPKEVDFVVEKLSDIISYAVNHSLHNI